MDPVGSIPSFDIVRGKNIQKIQWQNIVHPIMCEILGNCQCFTRSIGCFHLWSLDKSTMNDHSSAIILSANLVLCCGKDGLLRLFRNSYEVSRRRKTLQHCRCRFVLFQRNCRTLHFGLGSIQMVAPSTKKNTYLLSLADHPVLAEIEIDLRSPLSWETRQTWKNFFCCELCFSSFSFSLVRWWICMHQYFSFASPFAMKIKDKYWQKEEETMTTPCEMPVTI